MDEYEITEHKVYFIKDPNDKVWPYWRTIHPDAEWDQLMGNSWEGMEPPQELYEAFKKYMGL